ncbi:EF-P 5-aminopentanol modification-associated protein YfmH [Staphylococcus ureilyticus]|uniref:EF-P 5-aminopentanol modification-associated protein YfmH n=1 Tax=Staphylococcus ureilyticus TaxID=94138 RepID=UPI00321B4771
MEKIFYNNLDEIVFKEVLFNGLTIFILPKKEYFKTQVSLGVKIGSINEDNVNIPNGCAHFLEHQSFHCHESNIFNKFSEEGATINAYTNFTSTVFTLKSMKNILRNIYTLLDMVQKPYFSFDTIHKERKIIKQELKLYDNNVDWKARFKILQNMYKLTPIKNEMGGDEVSLDNINENILKKVYKKYYTPSNMILFVMGPVSPSEIIQGILNNQKGKSYLEGNVDFTNLNINEPKVVNKKIDNLKMSDTKSKIYLGLKYTTNLSDKYGCLKTQIILEILFESVFLSDYSSMNQFENIQHEHNIDENFGYSIVNLDSKVQNIYNSMKEIEELIRNVDVNMSFYSIFNNKKNKVLGNFISSINSLEYTANRFINNYFKKGDYFDSTNIIQNITYEELENFLYDFKKSYDLTFLTLY